MARNERGFTLVEVALAILVGLIVAISATTAFSFAKRSAIRTKQQRNVVLFKSMIEQVKAGAPPGSQGGEFYRVSPEQMKSFVDADTGRIPGLGRDPFTGFNRQGCTAGTCPSGAVYASFGPVEQDDTFETVADINPQLTPNASDFIYLYGSTIGIKFTVTTTDLITRTYIGYVVMESDSDGKIVAAAGGGNGDE